MGKSVFSVMAFLFVTVISGAHAGQSCLPVWTMQYQHDTMGRGIAGSKQDLFDAIRRGESIRMAWGGARGERTWEHTADPVFVTIASNSEVYAQLPPHMSQASYSQPETSRFTKPLMLWYGRLGTDGTFDAAWIHPGTGEQMRRVPQRARVAWLSLTAPMGCPRTKEIDMAVPGGVIRDPDYYKDKNDKPFLP